MQHRVDGSEKGQIRCESMKHSGIVGGPELLRLKKMDLESSELRR